MKVLRSWLEHYIDIPYSDEELADKLSLSGTSVEAIEKGIDSNVVVVEIRNITPHPQADRLQLATVFDGTAELTVVCGAPNIQIGQKVPLAKTGTKLPVGIIEKTMIRGVESCGMLCAPDELGIGEDHNGIFILPKDYVLGIPLSRYLNKETIFDLEITANRGDCLSHLGISREIGALTNKIVKQKPIEIRSTSKNISDMLTVSIKDPLLSPQYQSRLIEKVKITESPKWLKKILPSIGLKPINNIVDVTNYLMYDLGQPLHAFDYDKIRGKKIIVRKAKRGESITTLDGIKRKLDNETLVIADENRAIAIAGIMGGKNSEITETTSSILLEAAEFDARSIRKSAKKLNLQTEASYRFERGIDSGNVEYALNKAAKMIAEVSGGQVLSGIAREGHKNVNLSINIEAEKINHLLGLNLSAEEINRTLRLLGFKIEGLKCQAPDWRHDISCWQDLAEEIGRISGYDRIKPTAVAKTKSPPLSNYYYYELIKDTLADSGFSETMNYSFISEKDIVSLRLHFEDLLLVANPMQLENKHLRNSLLPGLLHAVAKNSSFDPVLLFEVGHVYNKNSEVKMLGLIAAGKKSKELFDNAIKNLDLKAGIKFDQISQLPQEILNRFKVRKPQAYFMEIPLDKIAGKYLQKHQPKLRLSKITTIYHPVSKYPSVVRDLAFVVDNKVSVADVRNKIFSVSEMINRVELFDEYSSEQLGKNKKNVAYHLYLQDMNRTMTDKEATEIINKVVKIIEDQFRAKLRT